MARSFAKVLVTVWSDADFRTLSEGAQRLYFVLLSLPTTTYAGTLPLQVRRWARLAPESTPDSIEAALTELENGRFVLVDRDTDEVLIRSFIARDEGYKIPNLAKTIHASICATESHRLRTVALSSFSTYDCVKHLLTEDTQPLTQPLDEGLGQGKGQPPGVGVGAVTGVAHARNEDRFADFWAAYPRRADRKRAHTAWRNLTQADREAAIAAVPTHIALWDREKRQPQHIPHPTTWLHGRRWEDDLGTAPTPRHERTRTIGGANIAEDAWS